MTDDDTTTTHRYAIVEQMGHRRIVGRISEAEVCGTRLIEVTTLGEPPVTCLIHPQSLYAITPCSEEQARSAGRYIDSPWRQIGALPEGDGRGAAILDEGDDTSGHDDCDDLDEVCP